MCISTNWLQETKFASSDIGETARLLALTALNCGMSLPDPTQPVASGGYREVKALNLFQKGVQGQ